LERAAARSSDPARKISVLVVALMAAIATFFLAGAWLDTR
jgi:hypothetical protein